MTTLISCRIDRSRVGQMISLFSEMGYNVKDMRIISKSIIKTRLDSCDPTIRDSFFDLAQKNKLDNFQFQDGLSQNSSNYILELIGLESPFIEKIVFRKCFSHLGALAYIREYVFMTSDQDFVDLLAQLFLKRETISDDLSLTLCKFV